MMEARFETAFLQAVKKHTSIKKIVQNKVDMILQNPIAMGEPLKGNWRGFYSCPVKRNFIIIYLFCQACRKVGSDAFVEVTDCRETSDSTVKFVLLAPHDAAFGIDY